MNHPLYFESPEDMLDFIKYQGKQIFKFRKEWEYIVTELTMIDGTIIILYWKGVISTIHSKEEMFILKEENRIKLVADKTKIKYSPFKNKKRRLTESEYKAVEGSQQLDFPIFEQLMGDLYNQKKFKEFLENREKDKN